MISVMVNLISVGLLCPSRLVEMMLALPGGAGEMHWRLWAGVLAPEMLSY